MIAKEGRIILIPLLFITFPIGVYAHASNNFVLIILYSILGSLFLFCLNFFRDPVRSIPSEKSIVVAPADGKVVKIENINDSSIGESSQLVSIFLNVFNVHVNRVPVDGLVESVERKNGRFLAAFNHIASDENEQVITIIKNQSGKYKIKQIAGLIARRILCYAKEDMKLNKGDRLGFIRFGSRTDIIMPKKITLKVEVGQKVIGGETIIGTL